MLYDRLTNSVWYPGQDATLEAVGGSRLGKSIRFLDEPARATLGEWLEEHPDSTVLLPTEEDLAHLERFRNRGAGR